MKTKSFFLIGFLICNLFVWGQNNISERTIEVNGKSGMEIKPDEITFLIGIEEYWQEEFEKKKEFKDYKTKVPLVEIEDALIKKLKEAGIKKEDIKVKSLGNYNRHQGKEFLFSKQFEIKVADLATINQLVQTVDPKGIKYMSIGKLNHSKIEEFQNQVRTDALKNAMEKAILMVESIGSELGEVISISEVYDNFIRPMRTNAMMVKSADMAPESINEVQNMQLEYQVRVTFRIK